MENNWLTIENIGQEVVLTKCSNEAKGEIVIPDGVTKIGYDAFKECYYDVTSVIIPNTVKYIGMYAFASTRLSNIVIPESVTHIDCCAFFRCQELTSVKIPESVTKIGYRAFYGCINLRTVDFPGGIVSIPEEAFKDCYNLQEISMPDSITSIGDNAFECCRELYSIRIPDKVSSIGDNAFCYCGRVDSIRIPKSVTSIGTGAFNGCEPNGIVVDDENPVYDSRNNCNAIIETKSNKLIAACGKTEIPSSVTCIVKSALFALPTRKIPAFIKNIENDNSKNWESEIDSAKKWEIEVLDFEGNIPETNNAFKGCEIEELRINVSRKLAKIPSDIDAAVRAARKGVGGRVVFAAPELCQEESEVPGYIKATMTKNDEIVDINTKYIVSVEPDEIERYHPLTGSIITCAANGVEGMFQIRVYESCDMVLQKIERSLSRLGQQVGGIAGLLDRIETLCKNNN